MARERTPATRERTTATLDPTRTEWGFTGPALGVGKIVQLSGGGLPDDETLRGLAGLDAAPGLVEQTGADTFTKRPIGISSAASIPTLGQSDLRYATIAHGHVASQIADLQEAVEDFIGTSIVAGADIIVNYSDSTGKTTISTVGGGGIDLQETVEDLIGTSIVAGSNVAVIYNDTTGKTTISSSGSGGGGSVTSISDAPPASPTQGQTWWESDTGKYFINYDDGTSAQWVQINGAAGIDAYTKAEADVKFVDVAGDTMTGPLTTTALTVVGTASVGGALTVAGTIQMQLQQRLHLYNSSPTNQAYITTNASGDMEFVTGTSAPGIKLAITGAGGGDVSVKNTTASISPATGALTVAGGVGIGGAVNVGLNVAATGNVAGADFYAVRGTTNGAYFFGSNGARSLANDPSTLFLTGMTFNVLSTTASTSSTTGALTVAGGVGVASDIYAGGAVYAGPAAVQHPTGAARLVVDFTGGIDQYGINCFVTNAVPTTAIVFGYTPNVAVGSITMTAAATAYNISSDGRLKEDLQSFDAGRIIDQTEVYDFRWKKVGERSYGIVAQQAVEVYPQAITYDEANDWWGVDYSKYVPLLLQELKALRARVAELEGKVGVDPRGRH